MDNETKVWKILLEKRLDALNEEITNLSQAFKTDAVNSAVIQKNILTAVNNTLEQNESMLNIDLDDKVNKFRTIHQ